MIIRINYQYYLNLPIQLNRIYTCKPKQWHFQSDCHSDDYYPTEHLICKNNNYVCEENSSLDSRGYCLMTYEPGSGAWAFNFFWLLILIPIGAIAFYLRAKYNKRYLKKTIEHLSIIQLRDHQSSDSPALHIRPFSLNNGFQDDKIYHKIYHELNHNLNHHIHVQVSIG